MNLEDIDPLELRRQMGTVLQNGPLLDGDIFTNIIGNAPLTEDDAWEAPERQASIAIWRRCP
jgi:ATP-binding cassette subfamily C protein